MKAEDLVGWLLQGSADLEYTRGVVGYLVNYITANPDNQVCVILDKNSIGRVPAKGGRYPMAGGVRPE